MSDEGVHLLLMLLDLVTLGPGSDVVLDDVMVLIVLLRAYRAMPADVAVFPDCSRVGCLVDADRRHLLLNIMLRYKVLVVDLRLSHVRILV